MKQPIRAQTRVARHAGARLDRITIAIFVAAALAFALVLTQIAGAPVASGRLAQPTSVAPERTPQAEARAVAPTSLVPQPTITDEARGGDVPPTSVAPQPTVASEARRDVPPTEFAPQPTIANE